MAGNGTIGLELLEDLPDLDAVVVPFGGGGLITGIASAVKALRPEVRVVAAEPETGAVAAASLAAGTPVEVDYVRSFVDGAGSRSLIPRRLGARARADRRRRRRPARRDRRGDPADRRARARDRRGRRARSRSPPRSPADAGGGKVVCIVSGGNIDPRVLARILEGETPVPA